MASLWWPGFNSQGRPSTVRKTDLGPPSSRPTTRRKDHRGRVHCVLGGSQGRGPWRYGSRLQKLALGTLNVTSLAGKELELEYQVEKFRLDKDGLTSTHSRGLYDQSNGTSLLEPVVSRRAGLFSTLEMPTVRGAEQGCQFLLPPASVPVL